jgi:hypothetical protein
MNVKIILAIAILGTASFTTSAQTNSAANPISSIKKDRLRICQGIKSGELTKTEAAILRAQTAKVNQERKDYKADGIITTQERNDLRKDKMKLSRKI